MATEHLRFLPKSGGLHLLLELSLERRLLARKGLLTAQHLRFLSESGGLHLLLQLTLQSRLLSSKRLLPPEHRGFLAEACLLHLLLKLALERGLPGLELASGLLLFGLERLLGLLLEELGVKAGERPGLLAREIPHPTSGNRGRGQPTTGHLLVQLLLLGLILRLQVRLRGLAHLLERLLLQVRLGRSLWSRLLLHWLRWRRGRTW